MILKIQRAPLLAAQLFRAKIDPRYYLCGICFAPNAELFSTDGHRLFVGQHDNNLDENVIIDIKQAPPSRFYSAEIDTDAGLIFYLSETGSRLAAGVVSVVDGKYPDCHRIIKQFKPKATSEVGFRAEYLGDLVKASKIYNPKFEGVKIITGGAAEVSKIEVKGLESNAEIYLMPMRIS